MLSILVGVGGLALVVGGSLAVASLVEWLFDVSGADRAARKCNRR